MNGALNGLAARIPSPARGFTLWRWRNRLLSNPKFQRWVARTPGLRRVGRQHAGALFRLCSGFVNSQVLYLCVHSGLLEALRDGPLPLAEVQRILKLEEARARILLQASAALQLTEVRAGFHGLGLLGAALLGNSAVVPMIEHQPLFYEDLRDPLGLLQERRFSGQLAAFWGYVAQTSPEQAAPAAVESYTQLMATTHALVAEEVLNAYPFARHRCLLDVGGGSGLFLCAAGAKFPTLALMLFDLPAVIERARPNLLAAGLGQRSSVHGGSFGATPLPPGADLISLIRVIHDHDDSTVLALLRSVRAALPPAGRILIAEPMRELAGSLPEADVYLGFYFLALGQGRLRSVPEIAGLLAQAGFGPARVHRTQRPWQCAVLSATVT